MRSGVTACLPKFQSTLSMRRATFWCWFWFPLAGISIHALHEESDWPRMSTKRPRAISIHALHEESDQRRHTRTIGVQISIHALHEESDPWFRQAVALDGHFNPRSP